MKHHMRGFAALTILGMTLALPAGTLAQTPDQIVNRMLEDYRQQVAGIDNMRTTVKVMGFETTTYMEKREVDGYPMFVSPDVEELAHDSPWSNPHRLLPEFASRSHLEGRESINGEDSYKLVMDDFTDLEIHPGTAPGAEDGEFVPESMTFYVDTDDLVVRRMEMKGSMQHQDGSSAPLEVDATMGDYRRVEGMWYPYRIDITTRGLMGAADVSDEEMEEARRSMEELEAQMDQMPEGMRGMLEGQLKKLREMFSGGEFSTTVETVSVEVNVEAGE